MKILHVTNAEGWSGGMAQMALLLEELKRAGHESLLVCPPKSELVDKVKNLGIAIFPLNMHQDYDLIAAWKLRALVKQHSPDVVHAHHPMAHAISLVALLGLLKPAFMVSRRVSFKLRRNPFSMWKYRSSRIDAFVVVSRAVGDTLIRGGVLPHKVHVIYSAIQANTFHSDLNQAQARQKLGLPQNAFCIGKVANAARWKGQQVLLEAAARVLPQEPNAHFVFAGKNTLELAGQAKTLGIEKNVSLLGFRRDVPDVLRALDVSVNAAIDGEGLSGAVRESFWSGVAVVASDLAGNSEIVTEGKTGFLFPPNNAAALADKILQCLREKDLARQMSEAGRNWVLQNATPKIMADAHISLYQKTLRQLGR